MFIANNDINTKGAIANVDICTWVYIAFQQNAPRCP